MPTEPKPNPVDSEIRLRMERGMLAKFGPNFKVTDASYNALLKLARAAGADPLVNTYLEIDQAVQKMYEAWYARVKEAESQKGLTVIKRKPL